MAHTLNFLRHAPLLLVIADMFNDRIREDDIEFTIFDLRQIGGIPGEAREMFMSNFLRVEIQENDLDIRLIDEPHHLPEPLRAADIEDLERPGHRPKQLQEKSESFPTQSSRVRVGVVVVGNFKKLHGASADQEGSALATAGRADHAPLDLACQK
jgi:hypothetical protein